MNLTGNKYKVIASILAKELARIYNLKVTECSVTYSDPDILLRVVFRYKPSKGSHYFTMYLKELTGNPLQKTYDTWENVLVAFIQDENKKICTRCGGLK